ncbi:SH3-like domain-containing protein [Falsiroseomonas selenitidurans]|uniref:Nitrile hydratase subunit beta n=1 Tax=Falsiroseomonas selenitidurans TaxID=2716335 RepID=A0ABX1EBS4_9PROT|nr:SH3-like domain-containing protein [Falsiroseomonas selenitidurans]NKC32365.1 nitrile hydratase subunit beta [Falsiroseomonas selenitidurans]
MTDDPPGATPDIPPAATHDIGGLPRFRCTPVEPDDEAPPDDFGKRVDALRQLLAQRGLMTVDELRRGVEAIPEAEYHAIGYYERWLRSITGLMAEKGVVLPEELRP